jgi:hypothetical protein
MYYFSDISEQFRLAPFYVDRILKGGGDHGRLEGARISWLGEELSSAAANPGIGRLGGAT